jgi:phosphinothricin acetyltransferase
MQVIMVENLEEAFMNINPYNDVFIREAGLSDIPAITDIYNDEVLNGVATFDTEIKSIDDRIEWFNNHDYKHPIYVACYQNEVVAWASLSKWSDRSAYDGTAEVSVYVHKDHRAKGLGSLLFTHLVQTAETLGLHYLLSRITQGNDTSIRLHLRNGFTIVGVMHEVGHKFGSFLDVTIMEKILGSNK